MVLKVDKYGNTWREPPYDDMELLAFYKSMGPPVAVLSTRERAPGVDHEQIPTTRAADHRADQA